MSAEIVVETAGASLRDHRGGHRMTDEKILAWHFTEGRTLRDGQPLEVGKTYTHEGEIKICESGYHASRRLIDALRYAPGAQISRVECWGDVQEQDDKLVARNRTVLWTIDATMILHEFACRVAEIALSKVTNPDPRSLAAIKAKRKWMKGKISDKDLDAAESAARSAVWAAAWAAAGSAAWSEFDTLLTRALVCAIIEDVLDEIQYERVDRKIYGRRDNKDKILRDRKIKMLKNNIRYLKSSEFRELCEFVDLTCRWRGKS